MDECEQAPGTRLFLGIDDNYGMRRVREAKAAAVGLGKAVLKNEDALVLDLLSAQDVERACILGVELVLQRDVEKDASLKCKGVDLRVIEADLEIRQAGCARDAELLDDLLHAVGELYRLGRRFRLRRVFWSGRTEIRYRRLDLRNVLHEEHERRQRQLFGDGIEDALCRFGLSPKLAVKLVGPDIEALG